MHLRRAALLAAAAVLLALLGAFAASFRFAPLPVLPEPAGPLPPASPPPGMSLSALPTGRSLSRAAFAYRGGDLSDERSFSMTAILVRHPKGDLLFDTGLGKGAREHLARQSTLMKTLSRLETSSPAAAQLKAAGYDLRGLAGVVLTHAHWDHVSGLDSLPGVPVWLSRREQALLHSGAAATTVARSLGPLPEKVYDFNGPPYLGFQASLDVWGDGSVVLVPAPGHTPGSIVAFLALPSGRRFALLGDLVWQTEGIELPSERPWASRALVDSDPALVRENIARVAAVHRRFPEVTLLPAHDARAMARLPVFPATLE
jgi:N-acyl homoserine lactone hydrolase